MALADIKKIFALSALFSVWACATTPDFPPLIVVAESYVKNCAYVDTISEISDPGDIIIPFENKEYYDGQQKVLKRTNGLGATHIVWLYNLPTGSSASVYRCNE